MFKSQNLRNVSSDIRYISESISQQKKKQLSWWNFLTDSEELETSAPTVDVQGSVEILTKSQCLKKDQCVFRTSTLAFAFWHPMKKKLF